MEYQYRSRGRNNEDMNKSSKKLSPLSYIISLLSRLILPSAVEEPATAATPALSTPPSLFQHQCHRLVDSVTKEVDGYFLKNWTFETEKAQRKFMAAGFSRVTCLYFPLALDDRIHFACRLLTILFLIDGELVVERTSDRADRYRCSGSLVFRGWRNLQ
jgi:aristolochene synthase